MDVKNVSLRIMVKGHSLGYDVSMERRYHKWLDGNNFNYNLKEEQQILAKMLKNLKSVWYISFEIYIGNKWNNETKTEVIIDNFEYDSIIIKKDVNGQYEIIERIPKDDGNKLFTCCKKYLKMMFDELQQTYVEELEKIIREQQQAG